MESFTGKTIGASFLSASRSCHAYGLHHTGGLPEAVGAMQHKAFLQHLHFYVSSNTRYFRSIQALNLEHRTWDWFSRSCHPGPGKTNMWLAVFSAEFHGIAYLPPTHYLRYELGSAKF